MESYGTLDKDELISRDMDEVHKKVLATIPRKFIDTMTIVLVEPITQWELNKMVKGKALTLDGIVVEFDIHFQDLINKTYFWMISKTITKGKFPNGITKKLITLIFKACERENFGK